MKKTFIMFVSKKILFSFYEKVENWMKRNLLKIVLTCFLCLVLSMFAVKYCPERYVIGFATYVGIPLVIICLICQTFFGIVGNMKNHEEWKLKQKTNL